MCAGEAWGLAAGWPGGGAWSPGFSLCWDRLSGEVGRVSDVGSSQFLCLSDFNVGNRRLKNSDSTTATLMKAS